MTLQSNNPVAPLSQQDRQDVPLKMVGGSNFGRYSKISAEKTTNMIVSDNALVPYAGYKSILQNPLILSTGVGRGIYSSTDGNFIIMVIGGDVYRVNHTFNAQLVNVVPLLTSSGDVFITENNNKEIVITDGEAVYVYLWVSPYTFSGSGGYTQNNFLFPWGKPGYCSFQNGRVIIAVVGTQDWVLSAPNNALSWPMDAQHQGKVQSKPGFVQAAVPVPGGGNNLLVFGSTVGESWTDVGTALFPYQRNSTFNIDYGITNPSTIAALDNFVVWISTNESAGPTLMYSKGGGDPQSISTDGIDFLLSKIKFPTSATGFLFRQDGHLIYQFTFNQDNLSIAYDFETELPFNVTDEKLDYHPARQVVYFNGSYYFVSFNDNKLYQFDTSTTNAQYDLDDIREIPRIRICPPLRLTSQRQFICRSLAFTTENGLLNPQDGITAAVDLSISRNGAASFGNSVRREMNPSGGYKSRFIWQSCGMANDLTPQFRFYGLGRWVVMDGIAEVYQ